MNTLDYQIHGLHFLACSELNLAVRNTVCHFKNDTGEIKTREDIVQCTISMRRIVGKSF